LAGERSRNRAWTSNSHHRSNDPFNIASITCPAHVPPASFSWPYIARRA